MFKFYFRYSIWVWDFLVTFCFNSFNSYEWLDIYCESELNIERGLKGLSKVSISELPCFHRGPHWPCTIFSAGLCSTFCWHHDSCWVSGLILCAVLFCVSDCNEFSVLQAWMYTSYPNCQHNTESWAFPNPSYYILVSFLPKYFSSSDTFVIWFHILIVHLTHHKSFIIVSSASRHEDPDSIYLNAKHEYSTFTKQNPEIRTGWHDWKVFYPHGSCYIPAYNLNDSRVFEHLLNPIYPCPSWLHALPHILPYSRNVLGQTQHKLYNSAHNSSSIWIPCHPFPTFFQEIWMPF